MPPATSPPYSRRSATAISPGEAYVHCSWEVRVDVRQNRPHDAIELVVGDIGHGDLAHEVHGVLRTERETHLMKVGVAAQQVLERLAHVDLGRGHDLCFVVHG